MIRVLVMIAVTGFLVSVVTISCAVAIAGPDLFTDALLSRNFIGDHGHWGWNIDNDDFNRDRHSGPQTTREMAWTGGDTLEIDVPAQITYTQAPGAGKLTVTGPQRALDSLEIEDGRLRFSHGHYRHGGDLTIVMTAPAVTHFDLRGSGRLEIENYKQDKLNLDISGSAEVKAKGEAKGLQLSMSGSSDTDLSDLKLSDADVNIEGSGQATLAPTGAAIVDISGSGDVTLLTRPSKLESNVSGSGSIHQKDGSPLAPAPPPVPTPKGGKKT
jgi:Putative auto-transporter adhesin, head GIN domain